MKIHVNLSYNFFHTGLFMKLAENSLIKTADGQLVCYRLSTKDLRLFYYHIRIWQLGCHTCGKSHYYEEGYRIGHANQRGDSSL